MPRLRPIGVERGLLALGPLGDHRGDAARGGEQRGGLRADDVEIAFLAQIDAARGGQLVDLALRDHRAGVRQDLEHLQAAVLDHQFEAAAEQEIADQHARRIAPDEVRGALAAAQVAAVDDVVVEQRRGVDELDRGGEPVVARAGIAEQLRARERQHRPHPLAAARDQMPGELGDQRDFGLHPVEDHRVDRVHVARDQARSSARALGVGRLGSRRWIVALIWAALWRSASAKASAGLRRPGCMRHKARESEGARDERRRAGRLSPEHRQYRCGAGPSCSPSGSR